MPRHARSLFLAAPAAALAVALAAPPAGATTQTWTVNPGGRYTVVSPDGYPGLQIVDATDHTTLKCLGDTYAELNFKNGSGLTSHIGSFQSLESDGCQGTYPTIVPGHLPWSIVATSYDAATHEVTGSIHGIHLTLTGSCSAVIDGTADDADNGHISFSYADPTEPTGSGTLGTAYHPRGGNLHVYDVSGSSCPLNDGDQVALYMLLGALNQNEALPVITSP